MTRQPTGLRPGAGGRLVLAITATAAINLGLLLALVELSATAPAPPPAVAAPLTTRLPPPPPPPPRPSRAPAPAPEDPAAEVTPAPALPPLALPPVATRPVGLPPRPERAELAGLPALTLPPRAAPSAAGSGPPPDEAPTLIAAPDLEAYYPPTARQRKVEGHTRVRLTLDDRGAVDGVQVVESAPVGVFDDAAVAAARRLRYRPARRDGRAVPSAVVLVLQWSLR